MMRFSFRAGLVIALPFILALAFVVTLFREVKSAFRFAWIEVRIELSSFFELWETGPHA